jgi:hypothetical protein
MRKAALAAYLIVLAFFAFVIALPYLTKQHDTPASVPSPPGLHSTAIDGVPGRGVMCMEGATLTKQSEQMRMRAGSYGRPGPPLLITMHGPSYSATYRVKAGWRDNSQIIVPVRRPAHDKLVTICIHNGGRKDIAFYSAADTAQSRLVVLVNKQRVSATPELAFYTGHTRSIAQNAGLTAGRIAIFRGVLGHTWIIWILAILFIAAVPVMLGVALWTAPREP